MKTSNLIVSSALLLASVVWSSSASALPSFARQTQMACASCHIQFPELTHFGRDFKLHGYTRLSRSGARHRGARCPLARTRRSRR